ncbi:MAG: hypothetical protein M4579_006171 [Chaenotheca gracillima]|nr:MAG: hypothetical protein M4579_006171 [Chaenotheca gracillima]
MASAETDTELEMQHRSRLSAGSPPAQDFTATKPDEEKTKSHRGFKFWGIFAALILSALVSALDGSIVSTALPTIVRDLNAGDDYVWVVNVYFLTSAAFQPLFGQLANIWGRRWLMIGSVAVFTLASGICGGASSTPMLIIGRAVQGIGAGGINMLVDIIICDLLPLRERANYVGLLFAVISIGSAIGPFVGGVLAQHSTWRWIFYLNLPLGGLAMGLLFAFLRVSYRKDETTQQKISRIDFIGNGLLIASTTSVLYSLTYGGTRYSWSDARILSSLILGLIGFVIFYLYERKPLFGDPVVPPRLFSNRTSSAAFFISFQNSVLTFWVIYFYPVYFQSVLNSSSTRAGVQLLPLSVVFPLFAALAGGAVTKTGRYKPFHIIGFALLTLGIGCSSLLDADSPMAAWVVLLIVLAASLGLLISTLLPAVQAGLPDSETAASGATWAFVRSLGTIWGVSIPAAIFNNRFDQLSGRITDEASRAVLVGGKAYEYASKDFINSFHDPTRAQVISVYADSLKRVWQIGIVFAGVSFLAVFVEKEIKLRTDLETDYGIEEKKKVAPLENGNGSAEAIQK